MMTFGNERKKEEVGFLPLLRKLWHLSHGWLKSNWALTTSVGFVLCYFAPILLAGRVLSPTRMLYNFLPWSITYPDRVPVKYREFGDVIDAYFPSIIYLIDWLKQGILPLWDVTITSGQPFILGTYFFFYPLNLLYLLLPIETAFTWHALLRWLIAATFTYLLTRELKLGQVASLLAALVFTFNGFHVVWLGWPKTSHTILLPLLLWLILKALHTGQDRYLMTLALVTGILLFGGFLPMAGYVLYVAGGFILLLVWEQYQSRGVSIHVLLTRVALIGLAVVMGLLMAAVYLLPFWESLSQGGYAAERSQDRTLYQNFYLPWWQIMLYLMPNYYGGIDTPYWGSVNLLETSAYVGVLPLMLALVSIGRLQLRILRTPGYLFALSLTILSLSVVYGLKPLSTLVTMLPGLQLSINTRLLGLASFGLALLAAYGLEFLQVLKKHNQEQLQMQNWVIGASLLVIGFVAAIEVYWGLSADLPGNFNEGLYGVFGRPSLTKVTIYAALRQSNWSVLLNVAMFGGQLLAGIIFFVVHQRKSYSLILMQLVLVGFVAIDLLSFAYWYLPTDQPFKVYPDTPSLRVAQTQPELVRFLAIGGRVLYGNTASAYQLHNALGHSIYHPARYTKYLSLLDRDVWNRREHGTLLLVGQHISNFESPLIDLLGVRYLLDVPFETKNLEYPTVARQEISQVPVGEIYGTTQQGQTLVVTAGNLHQIDLLLATYARTNHAEVVFHLKTDPAAPNDLVRINISADQIVDNHWTTFRFDPIPDSMGRSFYFYLESPSARPGNAITIWSTQSDTYFGGQRYVNGLPAPGGDLTFRAVAKSYIPSKFKIHPAPDMIIFENTAALPRAYAVPHSLVLNSEEKILKQLQSPDFNPRQVVILEEAGSIQESPEGFAFDPARVKITRYEPNRVVIEAVLPTSGWVVLTDLNYPGWTADIDGHRVQIYQANYLFRAVPVPPGRHVITFQFQLTTFTYGVVISLATLFGLIATVNFRWWRYRVVPEGKSYSA